jgi:hypothetical protein
MAVSPAIERFCLNCGHDLHPGRPVRDDTRKAAKQRHAAWIRAGRPLAGATVETGAATGAPTADAPPETADPPPAAGETAPVAELIYWTQCSRVLADLQRVAQANADRLRRECLAFDLNAEELDRRVKAGLTPVAGVLPDGVPAPPDWYPDPAGSELRRYWNGVAWTQQLS